MLGSHPQGFHQALVAKSRAPMGISLSLSPLHVHWMSRGHLSPLSAPHDSYQTGECPLPPFYSPSTESLKRAHDGAARHPEAGTKSRWDLNSDRSRIAYSHHAVPLVGSGGEGGGGLVRTPVDAPHAVAGGQGVGGSSRGEGWVWHLPLNPHTFEPLFYTLVKSTRAETSLCMTSETDAPMRARTAHTDTTLFSARGARY